jgi:hypothetical protein
MRKGLPTTNHNATRSQFPDATASLTATPKKSRNIARLVPNVTGILVVISVSFLSKPG